MQTTSLRYRQLAAGHVRPLSWQFRVSFDKMFNDSVTFFTLDTSILDGPDILAANDSNVVAEWDKYSYADYTDRIISIEVQREMLVPYSVNQAFADIQLNNYDGYFTRGSNSPIDQYLLPRRPVRILSGFANLNLPQFVGLTESVPEVDHGSRQASIHCIDFLAFLFDRPLDQSVVLENAYTHEVLDYLLQLMGLSPSQYVLDESFNLIPVVFFEKGTRFGQAVKELMEAELGTFYLDELGIIRFVNRLHASTTSVASFDESNIIDYQIKGEDTIYNIIEVKSEVRVVQENQLVFTLSEKTLLRTGTTEVFYTFQDPVTTLNTIKFYTANTLENGTGTDLTANVSVTSTSLFSHSVKVIFTNSGPEAYLTSLTLYGTPAKVVRNITLREQDDASVENFDERLLTIENNYIQDTSGASALALSLLNYYKDYANTIELTVKGDYSLQPNDNIDVTIKGELQTYSITKIVNITDGKFTQRLTGRVYNIPAFFVLDESILNGEDVLAP